MAPFVQRRGSQRQRPGAHGTPFRTQMQWCVLQAPFSQRQHTLSGAIGDSSGLYARRTTLPGGVAGVGRGVAGAVRGRALTGDARLRGVVLGARRAGVLFFFGVLVLLPIRSTLFLCFLFLFQ